MRPLRSLLVRSRWPVLLLLGLFLAGTNFCLVSAFAGPGSKLGCGMYSTGAAGAARAADVPPCHAKPVKSKGGPPAGTMPCCMTLAPAAKAPDAKPVAFAAALLAVPAPDAPAPALPALVRQAPATFDTGPPSESHRRPASERAPPLG